VYGPPDPDEPCRAEFDRLLETWNMVQAAKWMGVSLEYLQEHPEAYDDALALRPIDEEMTRRAIKRAGAG
jgi:hypothetical protein